MKLAILAVGHRQPDWVSAGCAEYLKRMPRELPASVTEIKPEPRGSKTREQLLFEHAKMVPLLRTDLLPPGYMYAGRWRHIAAVYAELGMVRPDLPLDGFLYEPLVAGIPP